MEKVLLLFAVVGVCGVIGLNAPGKLKCLIFTG